MAGEKKAEKKEKISASSKVPGKTTAKTPARTAGKAAPKTTAKTAGKAVKKTASAAGTASKTRSSAPKTEGVAFIGKMEHTLLELKSEIIENLIANSNDFKEIVEDIDPKDFADIASDDIDRKMIEALGSQELKRLRLIDSALTRIKQGKYGICIKCDKRIPQKRLEAIPYALMCIDCKSEEERRNR